MQLAWLLDHFSSCPETVARLQLRLLDIDLIGLHPGQFEKLRQPITPVTDYELEPATAVWQAYRQPTPEACFHLLKADLSKLPLLKPALRDLLEELPSSKEDFSHYNPIDRWWGGTHLTNDRLWRYAPVLTKPRAKR